jgi:hypothetical protein
MACLYAVMGVTFMSVLLPHVAGTGAAPSASGQSAPIVHPEKPMNETPHRRQQKTRAALHAAFRDLLLARGYEALTVVDVAALARGTHALVAALSASE